MREGELLGLRWTDIDWRKNTLRVQQQVQRVPGKGLVFSPPKTDAGNRVIALGQATIGRLVDHRNQQELERRLAGSKWKDMNLVFTSSIGTPIDPRNILADFKKVLKSAGLPPMRFHDLRHTSITMVLNEIGAPIKEAQKRAGHTRPSTTIDIYGGEVCSQLDEVVAQNLDDLVTPIKVDLSNPQIKVAKS